MLRDETCYSCILYGGVLCDCFLYDYAVHGNPRYGITLDDGILCGNIILYQDILYINIADDHCFYVHSIDYRILYINIAGTHFFYIHIIHYPVLYVDMFADHLFYINIVDYHMLYINFLTAP
eukprot:s1005_g21.t1